MTTKQRRQGQGKSNGRFRRHLPTLAALLIFLTLTATLLNKALPPDETLLPLRIIQDLLPWDELVLGPRQNRLLIDPFFTFYPNRHLQTEALRQGTFPLWNPYLFAGTPAFADPNFQPFYPFNLLAAFLWPPHQAMPWLALFHLTTTGTLTYLLLRRHRLCWTAAVFGGAVWLLNGYGLVWLENPHRWSTAAWLPGIFWAYETAVQTERPRWLALGGLFLGVAVLGGQVQFVFMTGLALGVYALMTTASRWQQGERTIRPLAGLIIVALIGLGIGALILLPAGQFAALSSRTAPAVPITASRWPATQLITLLAPDFYGNPATPVVYWGPFNFAEMTAYFGIVALLLALMAPAVARRTHFLAITLTLFGLTLAIALGSLLATLLSLLPGGNFLVLNRTIVLIPLFGAWLAAAGLDGWLDTAVSVPRRALAVSGALIPLLAIVLFTRMALGEAFAAHRDTILPELGSAAAFVLAAAGALALAQHRPAHGGALIILLGAGELLLWGHAFNPINPIDYLYPYNNVVEHLNQDEGLYRVLPLQAGTAVFGPNVLSIYGHETITGYASLIKADHYDLVRDMDAEITIGWMQGNDNMLVMSHYHPLTALFNVKYVLSARPLQDPRLQESHFLDGIYIYENLAAMPRAFLVHHAVTAPPGEAGAVLLGGEVDWRETAVLEAPLPPAQAGQLAQSPLPSQGEAIIRTYGWNRVTVDVETAAPALLVLADAYYPGWAARLDGEPVPIYETDEIVRGVFVPKGSHTVTFTFRPPILFVAAGLAGLALLLALGLVVWDGRGPRPAGAKAVPPP